MAQEILKDTRLLLIFVTGQDDDGEPILKRKSYNNVKTEATVDELFQAAQALSGLSDYTLNSIERNDSSEVTA